MHVYALALAILAVGVISGCAAQKPDPRDPTITLTPTQAQQALKNIAHHPKPLDRPLVVLGGFLDPGLSDNILASIMRRHVADDRIVAVSYFFAGSFDDCRRDVIDAVNRAFPPARPDQTVDVDVIGISMGGLVARYSALPMTGRRRLRIHRLFTVSTPNQGAVRAAKLPAILPLEADMRPGSPFLSNLANAESRSGRHYPIYPYIREGDTVVGVQYAAPAGQRPCVVPNEPLESAHLGATTDPRILLDILRRLRGDGSCISGPIGP
jgi:hypothetical protein